MWAVFIQEPAMVLIIAPGQGVWRSSHSAFTKAVGSWQRYGKAKDQGMLITVDHLRFDPDAHTATVRRDEIDRPFLAIGPVLTTVYIGMGDGTDDLAHDLDGLFTYRDDADRAAQYVKALARRWGGTVETV